MKPEVSLFILYISVTMTPLVSALSYTVDGFCTGFSFACAIINTNQAKCWGLKRGWGLSSASYDGLGDESTEFGDALPFINFGTSITVNSVFCGSQHMCAILNTGDMKCLGSNDKGQIGIGSTDSYIGVANSKIGDTLPIISLGSSFYPLGIALGNKHSCVKVTGNNIKCFGQATYGQIGSGASTDKGRATSDMGDSLTIINLGTDVTATSVHSGHSSDHTCIILATPASDAQRIKCWGYNSFSQLGYGDVTTRGTSATQMGDSLALVNLGSESKVAQLALGGSHTCALLVNDILKCWGYASSGQLSSGATATVSATGDSLAAVDIDSGMKIKYITAGQSHTCLMYDNNLSVKCVGYNYNGQLGQGDSSSRGSSSTTKFPNIPAIDLGTGSVAIDSILSGGNFNCVVFSDDTVKCFGDNYYGQLALGSYSSIGDSPTELGVSLPFARLVSVPTNSPSKSPTKSPTAPTTKSPTISPTTKSPSTASPTKVPTTKSPTISPTTKSPSTASPSKSPTAPTTKSPTISPTTKSPSTSSPTKVPTTKAPSTSPTVKVSSISTNYIVRFDQGLLTRDEAETKCQELYTTHLPTFSSFSQIYEAITMLTSQDFWIGLNDINIEGTYTWSSGSSSTYTYWGTGEPASSTADANDCVTISASNGKMYNVACTLTSPVLVCDMPKTSSPTIPTSSPTIKPTNSPSVGPTASPLVNPTSSPSNVPIVQPTQAPLVLPTASPTLKPSTKAPTTSVPTTNTPSTKSPSSTTTPTTNIPTTRVPTTKVPTTETPTTLLPSTSTPTTNAPTSIAGASIGTSTTVGLGVGIPVGVIVLGAAALFMFRSIGKRNHAATNIKESSAHAIAVSVAQDTNRPNPAEPTTIPSP